MTLNPASSSGGGGEVLAHSVTLTAAAIQALNLDEGSPAEIVPAPGAGQALVPFSVALSYNPGSQPFLAEDSAIGFIVAYESALGNSYLGQIACNLQFPSAVPDSLMGSLNGHFAFIPIKQFLGVQNRDAALSVAEANSALVLWSGVLWSGGPLTTAHVAVGGSGYAPGDTFGVVSPEWTYQGGGLDQMNAQCTVTAVSGGAVTSFSLDTGGINFEAGATYTTIKSSGGGDDALTIQADTVTPGNGTLTVTTYYAELTL